MMLRRWQWPPGAHGVLCRRQSHGFPPAASAKIFAFAAFRFFERYPMPALMKFLHIAAAIVWLGGISFMLFALRPAAAAQLAPPQRLPLIALVLNRFFFLVWPAIGLLLLTGLAMLLAVGMKNAPVGWHLMFGIGLLMFALFGHLYFGPYRRLKLAPAAADWPEGGRRVGQIAPLAKANLVLGALAIAAVIFLA
jgi:uncharacterized membrane protein